LIGWEQRFDLLCRRSACLHVRVQVKIRQE